MVLAARFLKKQCLRREVADNRLPSPKIQFLKCIINNKLIDSKRNLVVKQGPIINDKIN